MAISVLKCALDRIIECVQHDEQKDNLWGFVVSLSRDERSVIGFVLADKEYGMLDLCVFLASAS